LPNASDVTHSVLSGNEAGTTDQLLAYDGSNVQYVGNGPIGALPGDPVWRIKKLGYSGSDVTAVRFGRITLSNSIEGLIWDDRASYNYSGI
jgi:hypothetical protein